MHHYSVVVGPLHLHFLDRFSWSRSGGGRVLRGDWSSLRTGRLPGEQAGETRLLCRNNKQSQMAKQTSKQIIISWLRYIFFSRYKF